MCGRYALPLASSHIADLFRARPLTTDPGLRYNIAPTQMVTVVRLGADSARELALLRWGLVPAWSEGPDNRFSMINARAESVADKPAFRTAFRKQRCLVPAAGFYEWQATPLGKQPWYIHPADAELFAFAGIWERWDKGAVPLESCAVITCAANALMRDLHERMPVILAPEDWERWLAPATPVDDLKALLAPCPDARLVAYPVSPRVNSPHHDAADCLEPVSR